MNQTSEYTLFGRQVSYVFLTNIAIFLFGFVRLPLLAKGLDVSLYGVWSLISATTTLLIPFAELAFSVSIIRFLAADQDEKKIKEDFFSAYAMVFFSGIAFSALLFLFAEQFSLAILKTKEFALYVQLASVIVLLDSLQLLSLGFFRMKKHMGLYTLLLLLYNFLQVGSIAIAIALGYKLAGVITGVIASGILFNLVALGIIVQQIGFSIPKFTRAGMYLKWGIPLAPSAAIMWIVQSSDKYLVSYFLGIAAAGAYSAAYSIGNYALFALVPLSTVLYPNVVKYYGEHNLEKTQAYLQYGVKYMMMIAIPSAFGLSVLASPLLKILVTEGFVGGEMVVPFVAFAAAIFCLYQIFVYTVHLVNKTHIIFRFLMCSAALNIILNIFFIPRFGIMGAALATFIAYAALACATIIMTRRYLPFDLSLMFLFKSVFASCLMTLLIYILNPQSLQAVLLSVPLGAAAYFTFLFLIRAFSPKEITFFANFAKESLAKIKKA